MPEQAVETVDIELNFKVAGRALSARLTLPKGPARPRVMLPIFRSLTDTLVGIGEQNTAGEGKTITCTKGCGACCRQLVPVTKLEAWQLMEMIKAMESDRRAAVMARFDSARDQLQAQGMLEMLQHPQSIGESDLETLAVRYFSLGIACPFLEDESCSIHTDRPMLCREFLVTTPASRCAEGFVNIDKVQIPGSMANAVSCLGMKPGDRITNWVPLVTLPQWVADHSEPSATQTGPEILREVLGRLWGKPTSPAPVHPSI